MSKDNCNPNRRTVLKKVGGAATLLAGVTGSAAADTGNKDHYIRFRSTGGSANYSVSVPDPDANLVSIEGDDEVTRFSDATTVSGNLNTLFAPYHDELEFNGSLDDDDFSWSADSNVRVTIDGVIVKEG